MWRISNFVWKQNLKIFEKKEKEITDLIRYEGKDVIKSMISIVDDLERLYDAVKNNDDLDQSLKEGMALIQSKVEKHFRNLMLFLLVKLVIYLIRICTMH